MTLFPGLDIGGTKSAAAVGDKHGTVLARVSAQTSQGGPAFDEKINFKSLDRSHNLCYDEFSPDNLRLCMGLPE